MQVFDTLKLLMLLLGPSWLLLGRSGPKMAPKMGPQITFKSILKSLSQLAKITKICVFEHLCYLLCFFMFLEHQASQESPNTAKKPPKFDPWSHGATKSLSKNCQLFDFIFTWKWSPN